DAAASVAADLHPDQPVALERLQIVAEPVALHDHRICQFRNSNGAAPVELGQQGVLRKLKTCRIEGAVVKHTHAPRRLAQNKAITELFVDGTLRDLPTLAAAVSHDRVLLRNGRV